MIIFGIVCLLLAGLLLSAFFSGAETGFYRVTRFRLVLDSMGGDPISRSLLWLTNHPTVFVATTLIGNNVANYLTSLSIVLLTQSITYGKFAWAELAATILLSPLVYVYGELLPKNIFYRAPNRLLRRTGPVFLIFTILFAPIAAVLWCLGRILQSIVGETPLRVQPALQRKELQQVFKEGQDAGILQPAQQQLTTTLIETATQEIRGLVVPAARVATVRIGDQVNEVLRLSHRHGQPFIPVTEPKGHRLLGYIRVIDLYLESAEVIESPRPLIELASTETHIAAMIRMQSEKEDLAKVVENGKVIGLIYAKELSQRLFKEKGG